MALAVDTGTDQLLCSVAEHVATITLNRPEKLNALGEVLTPALRAILLALEADPKVRVVVLTGAGRAFCSGGDVSAMGQPKEPAQPAEERVRELRCRQETLTLRLHELAKPTITALLGAAAGAALSIALACDLRIGAESALMVSGFGRIGLSGDYGASWFLARLVGPARAKEICFSGRRVGSAEALSLGLLNEVVADDRLGARTAEVAAEIAAGPPLALRFMKENIGRAVVADLRTCLAWEAERQVRCTGTNDHREAVTAFLEKRPPIFRGR